MTKQTRRPAQDRAAALLLRWLHVVGVPCQAGTHPGIVQAQSADGQMHEIVLATNNPVEGLSVASKALMGRKLPVALDAFQALTVALGWGKLSPFVDRGPVPDKKAHYSDGFDLVAMRHNEFRRSPNLSEATIRQFEPLIRRLAHGFYSRNVLKLDEYGYDADDLASFGRIWLCNFFGCHRKPGATTLDDIKLFTCYMKQRLVEFLHLQARKARSVLVSEDTLQTALYGHKGIAAVHVSGPRGEDDAPLSGDSGPGVNGGTHATGSRAVQVRASNRVPFFENPQVEIFEEPDEAWRKRHIELDTATESRRRQSATALLGKKLGMLGHDAMVAALQKILESEECCPDARAEARRQLAAHGKTCSRAGCSPSLGLGIEVDDDVASTEAGGL